MFSRQQRLARNQDILRVMRGGKRIATPYVQIFWHKREDDKGLRFTAIVGKKVHKSAVKRHFYQRRLREIARNSLSHLQGSYDMVWVAKPSMSRTSSFKELRQSITPYLKDIS